MKNVKRRDVYSAVEVCPEREMEEKKKILIFGLGFTGSRLAESLVRKNWTVVGTVRNRKETETLRNVEVVIFDVGEFKRVREILRSGTITHVLITAPPMKTGEGDPVLAVLKEDLRKTNLKWCGYLSTTGVYGDCGGEVVDETAKLNPVSKRSERRVIAEQAWSKLGLPIHIFRLPGIYGPGRGTVARVRQGRTKPILKKGQVFNRVHVDDIVSALELSIDKPSKIIPAVFNVVDDLPAPQHVVTAYAYKILNREPIPDPVCYCSAYHSIHPSKSTSMNIVLCFKHRNLSRMQRCQRWHEVSTRPADGQQRKSSRRSWVGSQSILHTWKDFELR